MKLIAVVLSLGLWGVIIGTAVVVAPSVGRAIVASLAIGTP